MNKNPENRLANLRFELEVHETLFRYHGNAFDELEGNLLIDTSYVHSLVKELGKNSLLKVYGSSKPIYLYEVFNLSSNAICLDHEDGIEIGFFGGLRDVIYTVEKFLFSDKRFFTDIGNSEDEQLWNFDRFEEPIGFQNKTKKENGSIIFYPNDSYKDLWEKVHPKDKTRLLCGEFLRISSELFVWFHELAHLWRLHLRVLNTLGYQGSSLNESPVEDHGISETDLSIMRYLEHDADLMSLLTLVENIRQSKEMYWSFADKIGIENAYRLLFFSVLSTNTIIMINQIISKSLSRGTHPHALDRFLFIDYMVRIIYEDSPVIIEALEKAIKDWMLQYSIFGWKEFVDARVIIPKVTDEEVDNYCDQVRQFLKLFQDRLDSMEIKADESLNQRITNDNPE